MISGLKNRAVPADMKCMLPISQFFYVSVRSDPHDLAAVQHILQISRRNNRRLDVTGCLLLAGSQLAQVLEGRRDAVVPLVAGIAADSRHSDVRALVERQTSERQYGEWSMGHFDDSGLEGKLQSLLTGACGHPDAIADVMARMLPDTVLGALR